MACSWRLLASVQTYMNMRVAGGGANTLCQREWRRHMLYNAEIAVGRKKCIDICQDVFLYAFVVYWNELAASISEHRNLLHLRVKPYARCCGIRAAQTPRRHNSMRNTKVSSNDAIVCALWHDIADAPRGDAYVRVIYVGFAYVAFVRIQLSNIIKCRRVAWTMMVMGWRPLWMASA